MEPLLFLLILSLLLVHEMDAIRAREWKMFVILKDMSDETAFSVFTIAHIPLYFAALYALSLGAAAAYVLKITVDVFVLGHTILHYGFKKHKNNGFTTGLSKFIIYLIPVLAILHLCLLYRL